MNILQYYKSSSNSKLEKIKSEAKTLFQDLGFPTKKDEDWRYTTISALSAENYIKAESSAIDKKSIESYFITHLNSHKIVFIDGVFSSENSNYPSEKIVVLPFSEALKNEKYEEIILQKINTLVDKTEYLSVLNSALMEEGTFIYVAKNIVEETPIEILHINTEQKTEAFQINRNLFVAEDNSKISIINRVHTFSNQEFLTNSVTEIFVGKNAHFRLYKLEDDVKTASLFDHVYVLQDKDSQAFIHTFSLGGKVTRNELNFNHSGENINSTLKGITLIGEDQQVGNHTLVQHNQPNCESHELYRGIYSGNAQGIFNGKIKVDSIAQKTNAFQQNNSILLSDKATIDTKPQLEIFADDVKCSHGCTVGQLDTNALFYMKQRGIHEKEAKALLMYAFCSDVMESITIPELKDLISLAIADKLDVKIDFDF